MAAIILQSTAGLLLLYLLVALYIRPRAKKAFSEPATGIDIGTIPSLDLFCVGAFLILFLSKVFIPSGSTDNAKEVTLALLLANTAIIAFPVICLYFFRLRFFPFPLILNWSAEGKKSPTRFIGWPLLTIVGVYLFMYVYSGSGFMDLVAKWSQSPVKQTSVSFLLSDNTPLSTKFYFGFHAVVFAPLSEELIFRGYIYPVLKKYSGMTAALIFTAGLFGLVHNHVPTLLPLALFGLLLCFLYEKTKTIWAPIIAHVVFNLITVLLSLSGIASNS